MRHNRLQWDEWYTLASDYYIHNGNLLIEKSYITADGYRLGRWIERQRGKYNGKIPSGIKREAVVMLEAIGMIWKLETRTSFDVWISVCEKYYREFGSLIVPKSTVYCNLPLGEWIIEQRKRYSQNMLSENEILHLEQCGMAWSLSERRSWEDWYADAEKYYEKNGNLLVPLNYITENGCKLGLWIFSQRDKRKYRSTYPHTRLELLNKLNMVWSLDDVREMQWEQMYNGIKEYKMRYGKLPLWPKHIPASDGRYMDVWIGTQRKNAKLNKLTLQQLEKLKQIHII